MDMFVFFAKLFFVYISLVKFFFFKFSPQKSLLQENSAPGCFKNLHIPGRQVD
jgi:hypothetical protein